MLTKIILFTDIHLCVESDNFEFARARFASGLSHAQRYHGDSDMVIVCGDLTNKGDVASMQAVRNELRQTNTPVELMIGNHDHRENFLSVFPHVITDENGFVARAIDTPHARLLLLDTLFAPPYDYPKCHAGFLCSKRLAWLDAQLESAGSKAVVIFMHHPPHKLGFLGMDEIRLVNGESFYDLIQQHGNVRQIVAGHIHRTISGSHRGVPFATFKSTQLQMPLLFDTSSTSVAVDEPPSYGIILIDGESIIIHTEDFSLTDYDDVSVR